MSKTRIQTQFFWIWLLHSFPSNVLQLNWCFWKKVQQNFNKGYQQTDFCGQMHLEKYNMRFFCRTSQGLLYPKIRYVFPQERNSNIFGHQSFPFYFIGVLVLCYLMEHFQNMLPIKHFGNTNLVENFILQLRKNIQEPFLEW